MQTRDGGRRLGHLHEGEKALLHAGATRSREAHEGRVQADRLVDGAGEALADDAAHGARLEAELKGRRDDRLAAQRTRHRDERVGFARGRLGRGDALRIRLAVDEAERVHAAHVGGDFDGALGIKEGEKALAGADAVMVAALRADLKAGAELFRVKRLLAARTLGPDAFGNRTRLALVVVLALDLGENVRNPAHKLFISGSSAPCRATAGTDRFKTAPIISPGRNPKGAPRIGFTD